MFNEMLLKKNVVLLGFFSEKEENYTLWRGINFGPKLAVNTTAQ
jgi:hypothetical protein